MNTNTSNPQKNKSLIEGHKSGDLNQKIKEITEKISMMGSLLFALITIPAMPIIFYLTILYNVMIMVMEFFRDL
tara:strand:- start:130 stop:351 length:222 start_codon:yes stop_codon:yes gene_type:complete